MKRMVSVILLLVMLLSLTACHASANPPDTPAPEQAEAAPVPLQLLQATLSDSEWDETFTLLCSVECSSLALGEQSASAFPALAQTLQEMTAADLKYNAQIMAELLPEARAAAAEQAYFGGFTSNCEYVVERADDRILSVRVNADEYTGGVHPNYWVLGINLDPVTGKPLALSEVLTDPENLSSILIEKLLKKYSAEPFPSLREQLAEYDEADYSWTLDYQGITFYFSPYEIASYASGLLTVTIWYDEMPELFVEKYTQAPTGGWAKMLPFHYEIEADLGGDDGQRNTLQIAATENEYGSLALYVTKDGGPEQYLEECYGFTMKPLLVCLGEPGQQRYFLYIEAAAENDYTTIYIYDLNGDEITLIGSHDGAGFAGIWDEDVGAYGAWYEFVFNDPSRFVLSTRLQILGTWSGYKSYTTDPQSGAILPLQAYYDLKCDTPIISAIDLEVTMLPSQKKEILPAGTGFYFLRTDGAHYAELALEDGRVCQIEIVEEEYTPMINGVPEWDCFVNLMYAG